MKGYTINQLLDFATSLVPVEADIDPHTYFFYPQWKITVRDRKDSRWRVDFARQDQSAKDTHIFCLCLLTWVSFSSSSAYDHICHNFPNWHTSTVMHIFNVFHLCITFFSSEIWHNWSFNRVHKKLIIHIINIHLTKLLGALLKPSF